MFTTPETQGPLLGVVTPPQSIRTASAVLRPCQLRAYHGFLYTTVQGHHRFPVYLQNRVYGRIQNPELLWLCGTDHDSTHSWLYYLLGERARPEVHPGRLVVAEAERSHALFLKAIEERSS